MESAGKSFRNIEEYTEKSVFSLLQLELRKQNVLLELAVTKLKFRVKDPDLNIKERHLQEFRCQNTRY